MTPLGLAAYVAIVLLAYIVGVTRGYVGGMRDAWRNLVDRATSRRQVKRAVGRNEPVARVNLFDQDFEIYLRPVGARKAAH